MKTTPNIDVWLNQVQARSLRTVFDHLPGVMFFAKDLEGRFTMANLAFAQRCGCKDEASLHPTPDQLRDLDIVLFDIHDIGSRYYTYQATLGYLISNAILKAMDA